MSKADLALTEIDKRLHFATAHTREIVLFLCDWGLPYMDKYVGNIDERCKPVLRLLGFNDNHFEIECKDAVIDTKVEFNFGLCNAVKYLWRSGKKEDFKDDINKAIFYLGECLDSIERAKDLWVECDTEALTFFLPRDECIELAKQKLMEMVDGQD